MSTTDLPRPVRPLAGSAGDQPRWRHIDTGPREPSQLLAELRERLSRLPDNHPSAVGRPSDRIAPAERAGPEERVRPREPERPGSQGGDAGGGQIWGAERPPEWYPAWRREQAPRPHDVSGWDHAGADGATGAADTGDLAGGDWAGAAAGVAGTEQRGADSRAGEDWQPESGPEPWGSWLSGAPGAGHLGRAVVDVSEAYRPWFMDDEPMAPWFAAG